MIKKTIKQTAYSKKLLDPRWQKKRLEVMNRDNFSCVYCGDNESTLNIHHESYKTNPWESPLDDLKTLCIDCHGLIEHYKSIKEDHKIYKIIKIHKDHKDYFISFIVKTTLPSTGEKCVAMTHRLQGESFDLNTFFKKEILIEMLDLCNEDV